MYAIIKFSVIGEGSIKLHVLAQSGQSCLIKHSSMVKSLTFSPNLIWQSRNATCSLMQENVPLGSVWTSDCVIWNLCRRQKFHSSAWVKIRKDEYFFPKHSSFEIINRGSHVTYCSLMFFITYAFKGQVHKFAVRVKIVSHSSCRTSAIFKYFCTLLCILMVSSYQFDIL